jgi:hypothetical protein
MATDENPTDSEPIDSEPSNMEPGNMEPGNMEPGKMEPGYMETSRMQTNPPTTPLTYSSSGERPDSPVQDTVTAPARPKGPNASPVIFGLVALLFAGLVIAQETLGLRVDWSRMGPGTIVGIGVVMVLIGAVGLARRDDHL